MVTRPWRLSESLEVSQQCNRGLWDNGVSQQEANNHVHHSRRISDVRTYRWGPYYPHIQSHSGLLTWGESLQLFQLIWQSSPAQVWNTFWRIPFPPECRERVAKWNWSHHPTPINVRVIQTATKTGAKQQQYYSYNSQEELSGWYIMYLACLLITQSEAIKRNRCWMGALVNWHIIWQTGIYLFNYLSFFLFIYLFVKVSKCTLLKVHCQDMWVLVVWIIQQVCKDKILIQNAF